MLPTVLMKMNSPKIFFVAARNYALYLVNISVINLAGIQMNQSHGSTYTLSGI